MSDRSPFKWCYFEADIILCTVRWYLRYCAPQLLDLLVVCRSSPRTAQAALVCDVGRLLFLCLHRSPTLAAEILW
jgi:hypothetical protein